MNGIKEVALIGVVKKTVLDTSAGYALQIEMENGSIFSIQEGEVTKMSLEIRGVKGKYNGALMMRPRYSNVVEIGMDGD